MNYLNKSVNYYTLGCKLNFAESSTLAWRLRQMGFERAEKGSGANLVIVNTCAVTEQATAKCRQQIRKLIRENPDAYVVVTGCYAQIEPREIADIEGVDIVVGQEYKGENLTGVLGSLEKKAKAEVLTTQYKDIHTFHGSVSADDRTRHFLKVQDGCDYFCTYCTIPLARGKSRNPDIASLVRMAEEVVQAGGKEIVLTGVNIGDFGHSTGENFFDLCKALDKVEGIERYRISSCEPNLLTDELIRWVACESRRFAPHFHIPLQAGSDEVLKLMRRRYDTALFRQKIELIRNLLPHAFIGVDVMAGMRGETPELFQRSFEFLQSLPVSQLHPFTYSERSNTKALEIQPVVPVPERHERTARLVALSEEKLHAFYTSQFGSSRRVLWEQPAPGKPMHGFTENYVRVSHPLVPEWVNTCQNIRLGCSIGNSSAGPVIPCL